MIPDAGMDDVDNSNGESGIGTFLMSLVMMQCRDYIQTYRHKHFVADYMSLRA